MLILNILKSSSRNGAENVVIQTIQGIKYIDPMYNAIYVSMDGAIKNDIANEEIVSEFIQKLDCKEIRRLVKKYRPDIIHAHGYTASVLCALSMVKVPIISHLHGNPPWIRQVNFRTLLYGLSSKRFKCIIGVSEEVLSENTFYNIFKTKALVQSNPINIDKIRKLASDGEITEQYDIAFVGAFREAKNPIGFIKIISAVDAIKPVKAVMIGSGPQWERVVEEIKRYDLREHIKLTGKVSNPYGYIKNSKIMCAPRKWEGYGLAIAEALALGKPIVASPVGGIPYLLSNGGGVLCETTNDYVNVINKLLTDSEFYIKLSESALLNAQQMCTIEEYCQKIISVYNHVVEN